MLPVVYVFGYGSLLSSRSLSVTLPRVAPDACLPAQLDGHTRTFDVAFPNDGSQPDKVYYDERGSRPPAVLFANLRPGTGRPPVNGLLVPVTADGLASLRHRERRYELVEVTRAVRPMLGQPVAGRVLAFLGRPRFCRPDAVERGVLAEDYLATMTVGAAAWDRVCPGFLAAFWASTEAPARERIVALRRLDLSG